MISDCIIECKQVDKKQPNVMVVRNGNIGHIILIPIQPVFALYP
jgi:hypothetical protein